MAIRDILLIVNPVAGKSQSKTALFGIMSELCSSGRGVTVYMTDGPGAASRLAFEHGSRFGTLVCVGGDGTLSEVISGLMLLSPSERPDIGYIPLGTANDMASTLKIPKIPADAARRVMIGSPRPVDVGRMCDKYFGYIAAFGAFTEVSYTTPQDSKKALGHLAYVLEGMTHLPKITSYHARITYDGGEIDGDFVFGGITNSTSVAGLIKLDPSDVGLCDGLFEVILVKKPQNLSHFNAIINGVLAQNYDNESVMLLHTKKIRIAFDKEVSWTRDGEAGGLYRTVESENINRAVSIIV